MKENEESWEDIYTDGESYLEYPNEALVISYHRIKNLLSKKITCLDYGFGSGNNSLFLIDKVEDFYGIELSEKAKELSSLRLKKFNNFKKDNLRISSNNYIEEFENKFDLLVAWHVVSYNTDESLKEVINYFYKYLKKDGILIVTLATADDISKKYSDKISHNTYKMNKGILSQEGCVVIIPENEKDFENYFHKFETIDIGHAGRVSFKNDDLHSHYYGIFKK
jgi:cyclopropane fatty-acyl-phospholipid synthase-like methyltransferase